MADVTNVSLDDVRFEPCGEHVEGGGDWTLLIGEENVGLLCWTIDKDDIWRARVVDCGRFDCTLRTKDFEEAKQFAREVVLRHA